MHFYIISICSEPLISLRVWLLGKKNFSSIKYLDFLTEVMVSLYDSRVCPTHFTFLSKELYRGLYIRGNFGYKKNCFSQLNNEFWTTLRFQSNQNRLKDSPHTVYYFTEKFYCH